jgi:hypothetical protein
MRTQQTRHQPCKSIRLALIDHFFSTMLYIVTGCEVAGWHVWNLSRIFRFVRVVVRYTVAVMFQRGLMPYPPSPTPFRKVTFENLRDRKDKEFRIGLERQEGRNK